MMLYVATDIKNRNWLIYILEEFKRINKANFDIKVIDADNLNTNLGKDIIYYLNNFFKRPALPCKSEIFPDKKIVKLSDEVFIIEGTETNDIRFECSYDLLWNSFAILSRFEEYMSEKSGKKIYSLSRRHPRLEKTTFDTPIVNNLFNEFEKILKNNFPHLEFGNDEKPCIEFSHDVDYIDKTFQLRIKDTALRFLEGSRLLDLTFFLFSNPSYWCFNYWEELEKQFNKKSIFYFYARANRKNLKTWILDPSYNIRTDKRLQNKLRSLKDDGFGIGLHGSFKSAVNHVLLAKEKEILENSLDCEIESVRQHWLKYEENITPYIHDRLFKFDSTLGWNDRIGFRSGCAAAYRPYDHKNNKPFNFFEIPLVVMDSAILTRSVSSLDTNGKLGKIYQLLNCLKKSKKALVSILWHQHTCSSDYNWNWLYEKLIQYGES